MATLNIAIIHNAVIPAKAYGGTERVLWWLIQALSKLGHHVTLIAPAGSYCPFAQVITYPRYCRTLADLVPSNTDIIHSTEFFQETTDRPLILTLNGNGYPGDTYHPNTVFVSKDHARRHNSSVYVHNGINPDEYPDFKEAEKESFCYFLAKARWRVKNVSGAIEVARMAGIPIRIVGGWRPSFTSNVKWLGMTGGERKLHTLQMGSALLFPVRWHEPFGIAIIEAMITGSPVFGTPYGSLPELVTPETGFLSYHRNELAEALSNYAQYNRRDIRQHILNNFTHMHMATQYLELYKKVINGESLNALAPKALTTISPQNLLAWE